MPHSYLPISADNKDEEDNNDPLLSHNPQVVVQLLDGAVLEGLLCNNMGSITYQFAHVGIQEAAHSLVPIGPTRDQMLYQVGKFLQQQVMGGHENDNMLFLAARHWGEIRQAGFVEPLEMTQLFVQCGTKAIAMTAFGVFFARNARSLPWSGSDHHAKAPSQNQQEPNINNTHYMPD